MFFIVVNNFSYNWNTTGITVADNQLNMPISVTIDSSNTLYISDFGNNQIQKWLPGASNGTVVAGRSDGNSGSGLSELDGPFEIVVDSNSGIYVADAWNNRIVYWSNDSSSGIIVAGTGRKS